MRRLPFWSLVLSFGLSFIPLLAGPVQDLPTEAKSGIRIKLQPCFEDSPRAGYAPVRIAITNDSPDTHSWDFQFLSPGRNFGSTGNTLAFARTFTVPSTEERTFDILVPLTVISPSQYVNSPLSVQVTGYGALPQQIQLPSQNSQTSSGISIGYSGAINRKAGGEIKAKLDTSGPFFTAIDFTLLPADWRALSGLDRVWITEAEWNALPPGIRVSVEQWIATGGVLYLCGETTTPGTISKRGFGEIRSFRMEVGNTMAVALEQEIKNAAPGFGSQLSEEYRPDWPDQKIIPPYVPNSILLIGIILLFGLLVGPINFFVFARGAKRHRVFWTTPILSLGGALLVGATILVQDGFNGWGRRTAFVHLLPEQNSEVILQEQASRTALMTGTSFSFDSTALLQPISVDTRKNDFSTDGQKYGGDWFTSRRVQGHWLAAVRPSRARVQITNQAEFAQGQPPKILSSIGATLQDFYWIDAQSRVWHAANIGPGKTVVLALVNQLELDSKLTRELHDLAGPRLKKLRKATEHQPDFFYATAYAPKDVMLSTLNSIQWRDDRVLYLGPLHP